MAEFLLKLVCVALGVLKVSAGPVTLKDGAYEGVVVAIDETVPADNCRSILNNLAISLTGASQFLHLALEGRAYLGSVTVLLPDGWSDNCAPRYVTAAMGETPDVRVGPTHPVFGDATWTQQSQGCKQPGDFIYLSYKQLLEPRNLGRSLVREWTKYRYGVFDELGYHNDPVYPTCYHGDHEDKQVTSCSDLPIEDMGLCNNPSAMLNFSSLIHPDATSSIMFASEAPHVTKFCDSKTHNKLAPTKHNLICDRKSVMEVILDHPDFINSIGDIPSTFNTTPTIIYKRKQLTRYVLVIEDTMDMMVRESWFYLRLAMRKWIVYDLPSNTEVGLVLCNNTGATSLQSISRLKSVPERFILAGKIPYTPSDSHKPSCLHCGVRDALEMLKDQAISYGPASSVIVIIAPGIEQIIEMNSLLPRAISFGVRIATINYPQMVRSHPLDSLAAETSGIAYTVQEQKHNIATSYLSTYFNLVNVMFSIATQFYEGKPGVMPIEIHRRELTDDSRSSVTGSFVLDESVGEPSKFAIFTHSVENPLIRSISLVSPSQVVYSNRDDSLESVKIISLPANINETGTWTYNIERFPGNPQPYYIQVMATPRSKSAPVVRARAWTSQGKQPLIIYTEVKRGDFPVLGARVEVVVIKPGRNSTGPRKDKFELLDTGSGDPDITKGDGVYSRYFSATTEGAYTFEVTVTDNGNTAYSWLESAVKEINAECCGSSIPTPAVQPLSPFQRVLPPITIMFGLADIPQLPIVGRIGDLRAKIIAPDLKARLIWTAPDVGMAPIARYEIRYAHTLTDIIEGYNSVSRIWEYGSPFPLAPGSETTFTLDFTRNPSLLDQPLYIRIRAFADSMDIPSGGPVSNWVRVLVPSPPPPPPPPPSTLPTSTADFGTWAKENEGAASVIPHIAQGPNFSLELILPIVGGVALLTVCLAVYCYICVLRRKHGNAEKKTNSKEKHSTNGKPVTSPSTPVTIMPSSPSSINNGNSNMSITPPPEINNVALTPSYDPNVNEDKKRFSVVQIPQDEQQMVQQQHEPIPTQHRELSPHIVALPTSVANNISTISNGGSNTLVRGRTLSPYQSWTASQLLHEHERRHSPYSGMGEEVSGSHAQLPPPVPPLPSFNPNHSNVYATGPIYGVHPGTFTNGTYNRNGSLVPFNPSLQGSLSSVSSGDRKKRNVTMV